MSLAWNFCFWNATRIAAKIAGLQAKIIFVSGFKSYCFKIRYKKYKRYKKYNFYYLNHEGIFDYEFGQFNVSLFMALTHDNTNDLENSQKTDFRSS